MRVIRIIFSLLLTLPIRSFSQSKDIFEKYVAAWAIASPAKNRTLESLSYPNGKVALIIPKRNSHITKPNGNRYIRMYLVNSSMRDVVVNRSDATVSGITTEIKVDGQWKIHQVKMAPSCGYGAWKMILKSKHYLAIELDDLANGNVEIEYRVRLRTSQYNIVSNTILVKLRPELIDLADNIPDLADGTAIGDN